MPAIGVHDSTYDKLRLLAKAWNINEGEVIARLIGEFQNADRRSNSAATDKEGVTVHALYEGNRISAIFDPLTSSVTITTGDLAGQTFKSPSGAAAAQVMALNPAVKPNRSGWNFWTITETGDLLATLRPR